MRTFTASADPVARALLGVLADKTSSQETYRDAMRKLGGALARAIVREFPDAQKESIYLVCTVEDADYLARGVLEGLQEAGASPDQIKLACFWNERMRHFISEDQETFDIAPIVKQYREVADLHSALLVMVKSIISGGCVVKTNLSALIDRTIPSRVIVAAPVMVRDSEKHLASEFPEEMAQRFQYVTFAIDDPAGENHLVEPGIGGSVYDRLGMQDKRSHVPDLVKQRRQAISA